MIKNVGQKKIVVRTCVCINKKQSKKLQFRKWFSFKVILTPCFTELKTLTV